jgi:hypothetical protein
MSVSVRVRDGNRVRQVRHGRLDMKVTEDRVGQRRRRLLESRNVWKQRVTEKQTLIRYLRVKVRDLEVSRELWKTRAMTAVTTSSSANSVEPERSMDEMTTGE